MKYCKNCGTELIENAAFCTNCGRPVGTASVQTENSSLKTLANVFMIVGCVFSALVFLISLCWTIPMTIAYRDSVKNNQPVSTSFKVCTLIFVSLIAGIIMLCDNDN